MVAITTQKDLRAVQTLDFCFDCTEVFTPTDTVNLDHLPAKTVFDKADRIPLQLPTHEACNAANSMADQRFGQLLGLKRGYAPSDPKDRHLTVALFPREGLAAVSNLEIKQQVWRWIRGFHAALYREPCPKQIRGALETPFQVAVVEGDNAAFEDLKPQHGQFVRVIKENRLKNNLDRIHCNNGKLRYECVWVRADNNGPWMCMFALDVDGWKVLGDKARFRQRGCAGFYVMPSSLPPANATKATRLALIMPNLDPLDAFAP